MIPRHHAQDCCAEDGGLLVADGETFLRWMVGDLEAREEEALERLRLAQKSGGHKRLRRAAARLERLTLARRGAQEALSDMLGDFDIPREGA